MRHALPAAPPLPTVAPTMAIHRPLSALCLGGLFALAGCSAPPAKPIIAPPPTVAATVAETATAPLVTPPTPEAPPTPTTGSFRFAEGPLTDFGTKLVQVTHAAVHGEPLPSVLPLEKIRPGTELIRWRGDKPTNIDEIEFVAFWMELGFSVLPTGATEPQAINTVVFLSATGVRLLELGLTAMRHDDQPPPWLAGAADVARVIVTEAKAGRLSAMFIDEPERRLFANDVIYDRWLQERPAPEVVDRAQALARTAGEPVGYSLNDLGLVASDGKGKVYMFKMDIDTADGKRVLDTRPFAKVKPLKP